MFEITLFHETKTIEQRDVSFVSNSIIIKFIKIIFVYN